MPSWGPYLPDAGAAVSTEEKDAPAFRVPDAVIPIYRSFGADLEAPNGDTRHEPPLPGARIIGRGLAASLRTLR